MRWLLPDRLEKSTGKPADVNGIDPQSVLNKLLAFPRCVLKSEPTSIDFLSNLSRQHDRVKLYVKRDDCNDLGFGGNKVRQLEFYFGEAIEKKANTVLITGAVQSNFVRLTAAYAARLGMQCHIQLESRVSNPSETYKTSGNVLLNRLFGASLHYFSEGENEIEADSRLRILAGKLEAEGRVPYVIPLAPGHRPLGALGYVLAAYEIDQQIREKKLSINVIFVGSGSGSTHAGLLWGLRALGSKIKVIGVCVRRRKEMQSPRIRNRCREVSTLLGVPIEIQDDDIILTDESFAPGYGVASSRVWKSIVVFAQQEALVLDPTYTGKTAAAFLNYLERAAPDDNVMFIHTGGTPGIFAYQSELEYALEEQTFDD